MSSFVCPRGQTICLSPGGQTFLTHRRGGGDIFVGGGGGYVDVDEEMDVSKASKLSAGARIFRGP